MLTFSKTQVIEFDYNTKSHLQTEIRLTNNSKSPIYYKFKVNRPKFYLVKPDRGMIAPGASIDIVIKLHKQGIAEANGDKFKCFYAQCQTDASEETMGKFEDLKDTERVNDLPRELDQHKQLAGSELKSLGNYGSNVYGSNRLSYESTVREKEERVVHLALSQKSLKLEIESIQRTKNRKLGEGVNHGKKGGAIPYIIVGLVGLVMGVASSFWV